ncbi:MAG: efflux RND transporter periplasmic adaptor subunit [Limisphaerales bacterium]
MIVTEETKGILGLEVADVSEERLPDETRFTAQIFGEKHHHLPNPADHSGCDVHGSGLVSEEVASNLRQGDPVLIQIPTGGPLHGVILAIQKAVALGESEVIVGISNAISVLQAGEFVPASIIHPVDQPTATVPRSALLRTSEGTFVYTVNGDAYFRTPVRTGAESGGRIGITDGLLSGDQVVVKPVQTLWLIELRATKGGGHSH